MGSNSSSPVDPVAPAVNNSKKKNETNSNTVPSSANGQAPPSENGQATQEATQKGGNKWHHQVGIPTKRSKSRNQSKKRKSKSRQRKQRK